MRKKLTLDDIIRRHKESNPNTDYDYSESVLGKDTHSKINIRCKKHGIFQQSPHEHMKGQGCPKCACEEKAKAKTRDVEEVIKYFKEKFGNKFSYEKTYSTYKNMKAKCTIHCNVCGTDFEITPLSHLKGYGGCPTCWHRHHLKARTPEDEENERQKEERKRLKEDKRRQKLEEKEEKKRKNEETRRIREEEKERKRQDFEYKKSTEYRVLVFKRKFFEKYGDKFDLSLVNKDNYVNSYSKIPIICHETDDYGKEHGLFYVSPNSLLGNGKCPKCSRHVNRTPEEMEKLLKEIHSNKYEYKDLTGKRQHDTIEVYCKNHGIWFKQELNTHLRGHGCPFCNRSLYEGKIASMLDRLNLKYTSNKRFDWLGLQSLDLYIPELNIAIEVQGRQHFIPVDKFGGEEAFFGTKERDLKKNTLCAENGVKLIYFLDKRYNEYNNFINPSFNALKPLKDFLMAEWRKLI